MIHLRQHIGKKHLLASLNWGCRYGIRSDQLPKICSRPCYVFFLFFFFNQERAATQRYARMKTKPQTHNEAPIV